MDALFVRQGPVWNTRFGRAVPCSYIIALWRRLFWAGVERESSKIITSRRRFDEHRKSPMQASTICTDSHSQEKLTC